MRRFFRPLTVTLSVAALLGAGWFGYRGFKQRGSAPILPEFSELPAGPRASTTEGFGVRVGFDAFNKVEAHAKALGLGCRDTSAKALMKSMRAKRKKEREEKRARGEKVDAVSSASAKKKSPMERNPQIRYSCEGTDANQLNKDRPGAKGRLLFVFDSPEHPLRLVSYRRLHRDSSDALADARFALEEARARFGAPHEQSAALPVSGKFPKYKAFKYTWAYADLKVTVSAMSYGKRGIDILESVEVPWPVRADAPALPKVSGDTDQTKVADIR